LTDSKNALRSSLEYAISFSNRYLFFIYLFFYLE
jgi:hypothetical protein